MKSKILFLDDDPYRQDQFRQKAPYADIVATASECIYKLAVNHYDYVFLDHDLGGEVYVDSSQENCGMEVVRWIIKNKPSIGMIICHSLNKSAREQMVLALIFEGNYAARSVPFINLFSDKVWDEIDGGD